MNYSITTLGKKTIAGFHLVGPWDHTVKQGFEQLMMWVENHQVPAQMETGDGFLAEGGDAVVHLASFGDK